MRSPFSNQGMIALLALSMLGCQHRASGTYMLTASDGFCWLQLIESSGQQINGQLETFTVVVDRDNCRKIWRPHPSGYGNQITSVCAWKVQHNTVAVVGNSYPNAIVLHSLTSQFTLSGRIHGGELILTGWGPSPLVLKRAGLDRYEQQSTEWERVVRSRNASFLPTGLKRCAGFWDTNCIN